MTRDLEYYREALRREFPALAEKYQVASLAIFGSYVRGENRPDSDLDVLVEFTETPTLFKLIELNDLLSDTLGVKVDLVTRSSLKPRIASNIVNELVTI